MQQRSDTSRAVLVRIVGFLVGAGSAVVLASEAVANALMAVSAAALARAQDGSFTAYTPSFVLAAVVWGLLAVVAVCLGIVILRPGTPRRWSWSAAAGLVLLVVGYVLHNGVPHLMISA